MRSGSVFAKLLLAGVLAVSVSETRAARATRPAFAYVNANPPQALGSVLAYRVGQDGQSSPIAGSPYASGGFGLAPALGSEFAHRIEASRPRNLLFSANDGSGSISVFRIDPLSGALSPVLGSPFTIPNWHAFPGISLAVSDDGRFLYASGSTLVSCFIDDNGALWPIGPQWQLAQRVGGMAVKYDNSRLYLTIPNGVFIVGSGEGGLTPDQPAFLSVGSTASDLRLDPAGSRLWVGTKHGGILPYALSEDQISIVPGAPFFASTWNTSGLVTDFYGRFLFSYSPVGPRLLGAHSNANGSLELAPDAPLTPLLAPSGAALTPDGSLLLLATGESKLDAWSTRDDGALTHVAGYPLATGATPGLATVATFPDKNPTPAPANPAWLTLAFATALALVAARRAPLARG